MGYFLQVGGLLFTPPCLLLIYILLNHGLAPFQGSKLVILQIIYFTIILITSYELSINI